MFPSTARRLWWLRQSRGFAGSVFEDSHTGRICVRVFIEDISGEINMKITWFSTPIHKCTIDDNYKKNPHIFWKKKNRSAWKRVYMSTSLIMVPVSLWPIHGAPWITVYLVSQLHHQWNNCHLLSSTLHYEYMFFPKKSREEDVNKAQTPNLPYCDGTAKLKLKLS